MKLTIKNFKALESWAHPLKDFRIGEVIENQNEYLFRVGYNGISYTIKIFRDGTSKGEYEVVLRDGSDVTQFGRQWRDKKNLETKDKTIRFIETMIVTYQPKARQVSGNHNFNPF